MENVMSLTGASVGSDKNSAWCVPSKTEKGGHSTPIAILIMTSDGPRYVPTSIMAPAGIRNKIGTYTEVAMTEQDLVLQEAMWRWTISATESFDPKNATQLEHLVSVVNDVSAAARFLTVEYWEATVSVNPVFAENLCLGRSVTLAKIGETTPLKAWIVSDAVVDGVVEIVVRSKQSFHRVAIGIELLTEDGSAQLVLAD